MQSELTIKLLLVLTGWFLSTIVAGGALGRFLRRFEKSANEDFSKGGLDGAGYWIGIGERTLIYLFVISGAPEGIGFLVAAKSIFRIGEIKEASQRKLAEYILIGTLMSFTTATVIGLLTVQALAHIP